MANIIMIHGAGGNPNENWFPWLKSELESLYCKVFVPKLPTFENQSLQNWMEVFKDYRQYLDENTIVVGHSLGPAFLLSVLENLNRPIKAAFFVAGFTGLLNNSEFDELNKTFVMKSFDWAKIKNNCNKFYVINSEDDPYVPLAKGRSLAENLGTELITLKNAGHINEKAGYTEFSFLFDKIKSEL
jgi:uncharacterized protein